MKEKIDFLKSIGADKAPHGDRTLLDHLIGTRDKLKEMGAPEYLQDVGLFHSVYGTEVFKLTSTDDRETVRNLIGVVAEKLVVLFSSLPSPRVDNILDKYEGQVKDDLLMLHNANEEEQRAK
tara:strand:- start:39 stop:404 length:366 start_codon:yes stop_codon:yes gene_type:complete